MKQFRKSSPRPKKNTLVAGPMAIAEAFRHGTKFDRVYLERNARGMLFEEVLRLAAQHGVPVQRVPIEKLNFFNVPDHGGCIAQLARVQYQPLEDVLSQLMDSGAAPLLLILDGITDIRNIGGIARTAVCCGVDAIIIPDKGVGALQEDAILTSAGALEQITICRVDSLLKAIDTIHAHGITVYASEMKAKTTIDKCDFSIPCAIIMGSEAKGVYPALLKAADEKIKIPMHGDFESLNVSVATGMILYEAMKQRMAN